MELNRMINNQLSHLTPPMGWNLWNTFYDKYDAGLLCSIADCMVETGLRDAGYKYLIIDD